MTHSWLASDGTVFTREEPVTRAQEAFERRVMAAKVRGEGFGHLAEIGLNPDVAEALANEALERGLDDSFVWMHGGWLVDDGEA